MKNIAQIRADNTLTIIHERFDGKLVRLAEALGIEQPNLISRYVNGKKPIGERQARRIEKVGGYPRNWLDTPHPPDVVAGGRQTGVMYSHSQNTKDGAPVLWVAPLLTWSEALSVGEDLSMQRAHEEGFAAPAQAGQGTFTLRVSGASMEPIVRDDDIIFVDPAVQPAHQKCVVVRISNAPEALLRQYIVEGGKRYLKTANPNWPEGIIEIDDSVEIVGTVIGKWQDL